MLGHQPEELVRLEPWPSGSAKKKRRVHLVPPSVSATVTSRRASVGSRSATRTATSSAKTGRSPGRSSWIWTSSIERVGACSPPSIEATTGRDDVRLDVHDDARDARRGPVSGGLAAERAAVERYAQVPLRRDERDADVGLAGAAIVVVDDHVRCVTARGPKAEARAVSVHADLEPTRRAEDRAALSQHVRRPQRAAARPRRHRRARLAGRPGREPRERLRGILVGIRVGFCRYRRRVRRLRQMLSGTMVVEAREDHALRHSAQRDPVVEHLRRDRLARRRSC